MNIRFPRQLVAGWLLASMIAVGVISGCQNSRPPVPAVTAPPMPATMEGFEPYVIEKIKTGRKAVLDHPESAQLWGELGMIYDVHDLVEPAVTCYREAQRRNPNDFRWPYMTSICRPDASVKERANDLERAVQLRPHYAPAQIRLARVLLETDDRERARQLFERAANEPTVVSHAKLGLARLAIEDQDWKKAKQWLDQAIAANPRHREAHVAMARVQHELGNTQAAQRSAEMAQSMRGRTPIRDPARTEVMFQGASAAQMAMQGNRLRAQGKPREAIIRLKKSIEVQPKNAMAHFDLGLAEIALGNWQVGIRELQAAVQLDPQLKPAADALQWAQSQRPDTTP